MRLFVDVEAIAEASGSSRSRSRIVRRTHEVTGRRLQARIAAEEEDKEAEGITTSRFRGTRGRSLGSLVCHSFSITDACLLHMTAELLPEIISFLARLLARGLVC